MGAQSKEFFDNKVCIPWLGASCLKTKSYFYNELINFKNTLAEYTKNKFLQLVLLQHDHERNVLRIVLALVRDFILILVVLNEVTQVALNCPICWPVSKNIE